MRTGLDVLLDTLGADRPHPLRGARLGLCCNHTAITGELKPALSALRAVGLNVVRLFGPEHGISATAQDMVAVEGCDGDVPVVSLYGETAASLRPAPEALADLDAVLFDIQDIGTRYYTYEATLGYLMEVAAETGTRVVVLDRPNPINGVTVEGNVVQPGFESFVSAYPLAVRHGMTIGELATFLQQVLAIDCPLEVIRCEGWRRDRWYDETGLAWVYPSPNMPTLETAAIYPGMCLIEGTNLSEGRGTTRPFHLVGAPWLDAADFTRLCRRGAFDAGLQGVGFRAASFRPEFQKHAGQVCHGTEIVVRDRYAMEPFLLGLVVLEAALRAAPDDFRWRTTTYEFVDDPIAIDLLTGSAETRLGLESRVRPRELVEAWRPELEAFLEQREGCLLYGP